ncbi:winged helix-turn-helix transcriptional regulator [Peribacillus sp. B-H-3]|uniref:winged helix-turn-helix transcriptional regulator n=1 Tax=Peribacillus sp. B-H-3 TaxID=3400420 RepID=UPI003B011AD7
MKSPLQLCPKIEFSYEIIGKKWAGLIIHVLMDGPRRFNEVHEMVPNLSKRMLTERMKEFEELGIVIRNVIAERPVKIEYSLTKKGFELGKALSPVQTWAEKWIIPNQKA